MSDTVLITGAGSGIGRACANAFAAGGWRVLASGRDLEALGGFPDGVERLRLDIVNPADRTAAAAAVSEGLDCLVLNAGIGMLAPLEEISEEALRRQFEVNFFAHALTLRALLPALRAAQGHVIAVSSMAAFAPRPLQGAYAASKAALEGLCSVLLEDVRAHGVAVSIVELGAYRTRFAARTLIEGGGAGSPYQHQVRQAVAARRSALDRGGRAPEEVGRRIARLAERAHPPFRVRIGPDAALAGLARAILPEGLFRRVLRLAARHSAPNGRADPRIG